MDRLAAGKHHKNRGWMVSGVSIIFISGSSENRKKTSPLLQDVQVREATDIRWDFREIPFTWESLQFQPYFTAVASNIGYGWWSHDIGGHMLGYKDDEMTAEWTQFGVYSPYSCGCTALTAELNGKEPWRFKPETEKAIGEAMRERHRLLPYLYTMNYRAYKEGLPLVQPMYYEYPENGEAYYVKNQYLFGSVLMVAPVTSPREKGINRAKTVV